MLQPKLTLKVIISSKSRTEISTAPSGALCEVSHPIKIRFAAVISSSSGKPMEAVQSE
jgi:hypothetical protein